MFLYHHIPLLKNVALSTIFQWTQIRKSPQGLRPVSLSFTLGLCLSGCKYTTVFYFYKTIWKIFFPLFLALNKSHLKWTFALFKITVIYSLTGCKFTGDFCFYNGKNEIICIFLHYALYSAGFVEFRMFFGTTSCISKH